MLASASCSLNKHQDAEAAEARPALLLVAVLWVGLGHLQNSFIEVY